MKKFLPKLKNNPQGFTLIELMVVISIIAFLSVIGIASYTATQKSARDARRRADINSIASALEANGRNNTLGTYTPAGLTIGSNTATNDTFDGYFSSGKAPSDPVNSVTYFYQIKIPAAGTTNANNSFTACATLEKNTSGNATSLGDGTTFTASTTGSTFCVKNRQ